MAKKCKRHGVDPTTATEIEYTDAETQFILAMDEYKRKNNRRFPTWSEALEVLVSLGYRQVEMKGPIPTRRREMSEPNAKRLKER